MTLWIFGASASTLMDNVPDQWMQKAASLLNTDVKSLAIFGASLEFNYQKFNKIRNRIKENDVIVFYIPGFERRWFFKDRPGDTVLLDMANNKEEQNAIDLYITYLENTSIYEVYFLNFLCNVEYLTKKLNLNTIILNPYIDLEEFINLKKGFFPSIHVAKGLMVYVTCDEYQAGLLRKLGNTRGVEILDNDLRLNHMSRSNHLILADKIYNYVKNKTPIDVTTGFKENIYTEEAIKDPEFVKYELFDMKYRKDAELTLIESLDNIVYKTRNDA